MMIRPMRDVLAALLILGIAGLMACKENKPADKPAEPTRAEKPADKPAEPAADKPSEPNTAPAKAMEGGTTEDDGNGNLWVMSDLYGVKFRVPSTWEVTIDAEGITAVDEDNTTTVILVGSDSAGMIQAAINDIKKKVAFKDAKFDKADTKVINGLAGQVMRGSAVIEKGNAEANADQEIQFLAYNLSVGKKAVTMMIFSEAEMYEAKKEIIEGIGETIAKK
jgi:hypothetical protein